MKKFESKKKTKGAPLLPLFQVLPPETWLCSHSEDLSKFLLSFWQCKGKSNFFEIYPVHCFFLKKVCFQEKIFYQRLTDLEEERYPTFACSSLPHGKTSNSIPL